jgi:SPP1 gp7 family putative phage head morphogenesis protein
VASLLYEAIQSHRAALIAREEAVILEMLETYKLGYLRVSFSLDQISERIEARRRQGKPISEDWLYREARLSTLLDQAREEFDSFSRLVESKLTEEQRQAIQMAADHSRELMTIAQGPVPKTFNTPLEFAQFNPDVVEGLAGRLSNGAPLNSLLQEIGPDAVNVMREVWAGGIIQGKGIRAMGAELAASLENVSVHRATTIIRTETLGAYRTVAQEQYRQSRAVKGWAWTCTRNKRTCAMCWAMDGREFPLDQEFASHPNCRCIARPIMLSWEERGFKGLPDRRRTLEVGESYLKRQSEEYQIAVLGRKKHELWRSGNIELQDLVGYREDPVWGPNRWERSLIQIENGRFIPPASVRGTVPRS